MSDFGFWTLDFGLWTTFDPISKPQGQEFAEEIAYRGAGVVVPVPADGVRFLFIISINRTI
jgi:hypothetical protein